MAKTQTITTLALAMAIALGGALTVAAPSAAVAGGQRVLLAKNGDGTKLFNLYQQIQQLQEQVRQLNGEVDTLQHSMEQNQQRQRDLYQALDKRLSKLENGGAAASANNPSQNTSQAGSDNGDMGQANDVNQATQSAYMRGFNQLQKGQYEAAIASFKSFVSNHPDTSLTDNAWYWLGEAYYVQQQLGSSKHAFQVVINQFPKSSKVPDSLYKIGEIEAAKGQTSKAMADLKRVVSQYPNSDAAGRAKQKLHSLPGQ